MDLGLRIKKYRTQQKRTQQDIADQCGFSKSLISKIENGKVVPPIATLVKIGQALGVKVSNLLDDDRHQGVVYNSADKITEKSVVRTEEGYSFYTLAADYTNKKVQPLLMIAKKEEVIDHSLSHDGEEFVYVLEGSMKYKVGDVEYTLKEGDSIYFNSLLEHKIKPITDEVKYINVFI